MDVTETQLSQYIAINLHCLIRADTASIDVIEIHFYSPPFFQDKKKRCHAQWVSKQWCGLNGYSNVSTKIAEVHLAKQAQK
jgi:hypothetical protein